jgi:hypothetical protein
MERKSTDLAEVREQDERLAYGQDFSQPQNEGRTRIALAVLAVVVALVSFFVLGSFFTNPDTFKGVMETLDQKKSSVMSLMGASTGSSAAISLLPGDAGTPIAEKLVDLSSDFLIVLAAIYLEKYLLTILGFAAFKVLVPVSCALLLLAVVAWRQPQARAVILRIAFKMALFGLAAFLVVPVSVKVSSMIEGTYEASINATLEAAEQTTEAIEQSAEEGDSKDANNPLAFLLNMPDELNKLTKSAQDSLSNFIEALAVMIVTSCIIPILVLVFFLWLAKMILGINVDIPYPPLRHHRRH